ncbi:MAG TPA: fused MFS/spermidine synthase [Labilithrix sp.]|nr:fused MFS/spermidine synthase [Labilithrix sp.]
MRSPLTRVAGFLFFSGACALIYQVAWFRELRLIFGASTAASAAVLAIFMAGLGIGGARLGKRADAAKNPLGLYANLEIGVACTAAATPVLVWLADKTYVATGGSSTLGTAGATLVRIVLSVIVLGPSTFLMGGTLPAAARAVEDERDGARRRVAVLYGVNTFGAVLGTLLANFFVLEIFGTRLTLWIAALVNLLVAVIARGVARRLPEPAEVVVEAAPRDEPAADASFVAQTLPWFPPAAAALAGAAFMLMELVWYRMLAPLLGGSSYTFGLILAVALFGIGIGGALYSRLRVAATLRALCITYALEAVFVAIPLALGDQIAMVTALLRPFNRLGFGSSVIVWSLVAAFVVLPAAIVSGLQFPLIIGLYGRGAKSVGRDVGAAYLANTVGSIAGSLGGGFGLVPLLGAVGSWRLVVAALLAGAAVALALDVRERGLESRRVLLPALCALVVLPLLFADGPSAVWRHSGIGAGRADSRIEPVTPSSLAELVHEAKSGVAWDVDGAESSVALGQNLGYTFIVNGKADGHAIADAPTQVMGGLLPALLHPDPKTSLVIGLGTGSSAGWLGRVPGITRVDVVELEPAILRVARDCAPVNEGVLDNPKVRIQLADAREVLRTKKETYDLVFSEPSNPYRAGISSLYTEEFYRAVSERLAPGGIFVQWLQGYDIDGWGFATALRTLRSVFADVSIWETTPSDFLLFARHEKTAVDVARIRERLAQAPFAAATRAAWRTDTAEGVLGHYVASGELSELFLERGFGSTNTDDQNLLEFALARHVGSQGALDFELTTLARRFGLDQRGFVGGPIDWTLVQDERAVFREWQVEPADAPLPSRPASVLSRSVEAYRSNDGKSALAAWKKLGRAPRSLGEASMVAHCAARFGATEDEPLLALAIHPAERAIFTASWHVRANDPGRAVDQLVSAFVAMRTDPWPRRGPIEEALVMAMELGVREPSLASRLAAAIAEPFAVQVLREKRLRALAQLGDVVTDPRFCVAAHEGLSPPGPDAALIALRARCFERAGHPGLGEAKQRLAESGARGVAFPIALPPLQLPMPADAGAHD